MGFEPMISRMKTWRPRPARRRREVNNCLVVSHTTKQLLWDFLSSRIRIISNHNDFQYLWEVQVDYYLLYFTMRSSPVAHWRNFTIINKHILLFKAEQDFNSHLISPVKRVNASFCLLWFIVTISKQCPILDDQIFILLGISPRILFVMVWIEILASSWLIPIYWGLSKANFFCPY